MGVKFRGKVIFKRWSSLVVSCLVALFFGVLIFSIGAASSSVGGVTLEGVFTILIVCSTTPLLVWFFFSLGVFTGIDVKNDRVVVKSFMGEVEISLNAISRVESNGGIGVRLKNGRRINCTAFPDSLYSLLIGYRNFRGVALSVEKLVVAESEKDGGDAAMWAFERNCWNVKSLLVLAILYPSTFAMAYLIF